MNMRNPLGMVEKWRTLQYWSCEKPHITRSALVVLTRLLHRQNTRTGQCNPSIARLVEETGFCRRSVSKAFTELAERGAVERYRKSLRARTQFLIYSTEELAQNQHSVGLKKLTNLQKTRQRSATRCAAHCLKHRHPTAPEKIKETIKKKSRPKNKVNSAENKQGQRKPPINFDLGEFERRAAKVFEKEGFGYEGLVDLQTGEMERVFELMKDGELSFSKAIGELLQIYRDMERYM